MLIELGLRVYRIQREKKESGFNQMEYNKIMLDNISRVRFMCSEIMNMSMLNQESVSSGHFTIEKIKPAMEKFVNEQVGIFFMTMTRQSNSCQLYIKAPCEFHFTRCFCLTDKYRCTVFILFLKF